MKSFKHSKYSFVFHKTHEKPSSTKAQNVHTLQLIKAQEKMSKRSKGKNASQRRQSYTAVPAKGSDSDSDQGLNVSATTLQMLFNQSSLNQTSQSQSHSKIKMKALRPIAPLPMLSLEEYDFFEKVESGDLDGVEECLQTGGININKFNRMGYTVLHLAVRRQDEDMVKLLLTQEGILLYDTILHSTREGNKEITSILLDVHDSTANSNKSLQMSCSRVGTPTPATPSTRINKTTQTGITSSLNQDILNGILSRTGSTKSKSVIASTSNLNTTGSSAKSKHNKEDDIPFDSEFHPVITPLMLAAQGGHTSLMDLFYSRGERLETEVYTHNITCECDICAKLKGDQDMTRAHQRRELFKSITKPEYICFIARKEKIDPINYAIDKILKLRHLCARDTAYDKEYEEPIKGLEEFITKMLDLCRTNEETAIFLSPKDTEGKLVLPHLYPRLWYTVGLDLKTFVASPNFQNLVFKMWATDDWPAWDAKNFRTRFSLVVFRVLGLLSMIIPAILWAAPESGTGRKLAAPVSRFINYIVTYMIFLACLGIQVLFPYQRCNNEWPYYKMHDRVCKQRGPPQIGTEWILVAYMVGFLVSMLKRQSVSWYWQMKWNKFEFLMIISFTLTFSCWLWAWIWTKMPENKYLINATERQMWDHDSAEILGECFLAISTMFACGRLLRFVQVFPTIGPIQIGLGRQLVDFGSTFCIFGTVWFAIASGLLALYVPYKDFDGYDTILKIHKKQDSTFTSLSSTLQNLFWYLFGHASMAPATLLSWDIEKNGTPELNHHDWTQYTGMALYFLYHLMGNLMLFSMLSGYFAQTLATINENVDVYWKYNRTELYLTFIKDTMLPPPLNLIPPLETILNLITFKYCALMGKKKDPRLGCSCRQCCYITQGIKKDKWKEMMQGYRRLIVELMFRYADYKEDATGKEKATRDDVMEIGEELDELIAKLSSDLKKSSKDSLPDDDNNPPPVKSYWQNPRNTLANLGSKMFTKKATTSRQTGTGTGASSVTPNMSACPAGVTASPSLNQTGSLGGCPVASTSILKTPPPPSKSTPGSGFNTTGLSGVSNMFKTPPSNTNASNNFSGGSYTAAQLSHNTPSKQTPFRTPPSISTPKTPASDLNSNFMSPKLSLGLKDFSGGGTVSAKDVINLKTPVSTDLTTKRKGSVSIVKSKSVASPPLPSPLSPSEDGNTTTDTNGSPKLPIMGSATTRLKRDPANI